MTSIVIEVPGLPEKDRHHLAFEVACTLRRCNLSVSLPDLKWFGTAQLQHVKCHGELAVIHADGEAV